MTVMNEQEFRDRQSILDVVRREGVVAVRCDDGSEIIMSIRQQKRRPLDVGFVPGLHLTREEILESIQDGRDRFVRDVATDVRGGK